MFTFIFVVGCEIELAIHGFTVVHVHMYMYVLTSNNILNEHGVDLSQNHEGKYEMFKKTINNSHVQVLHVYTAYHVKPPGILLYLVLSSKYKMTNHINVLLDV